MTAEQIFLYAARMRDRYEAMNKDQNDDHGGGFKAKPQARMRTPEEMRMLFPGQFRRIQRSSDN